MPSGYGKQAAYAGSILVGLGHQVSFSSFAGLTGQPITRMVQGLNGRTLECAVYPSGIIPFGADVIVANARFSRADLIVSIMDTYMLKPAAEDLKACGIPFAPLVVTDSTAANNGPSMQDQELLLRSKALPAAVCQFGQDRLKAIAHALPEGWDPPLVSHAVDTTVYQPPADRTALREENGTRDQFVIGIMAANRDPMRKGFAEQFEAFARFSKRHPEARLAVFTVVDSPGGLPLDEMALDFGIRDKVMFMPTYEQLAGLLNDNFTAEWLGGLDILSACSYGEGFCIPALEAQACGTPVVATDCTALTELARPAGWLVTGQRYWQAAHRGWWKRPDVTSIVKAWEKARKEWNTSEGEDRRARAAAFARGYSLEVTAPKWELFLKQVTERKESTS
jgi:glycosyltransferase involved in cell wall biosynthesis